MAVKALREAQEDVLRDLHFVTNEHGISVPATRIEPARTNSALHSEDFTASAWSSALGTNGVTVTADDAVAADGWKTADLITPGGSTDDGIEQTYTVADDSLDRAIFFLLKKGGSPRARVEIAYTGGTTEVDEWIDVDTGDGTVVATSGGETRAGVQDAEISGYWKVWIVAANNSTGNTTLRQRLRPDAADGGDAVHAWGAQLEGVSGGVSAPSSYLATAGSSTARAADAAEDSFTASPQEQTFYGKAKVRSIPASGTETLAYIGGSQGAGDAWLAVEIDASGQIVATHDNGSSEVSSTAATSAGVGDVVEWRVVLAADGSITAHASVGGGAEVSGSTSAANSLASSWSADAVEFGAANGSIPGALDLTGLDVDSGTRTMAEMRVGSGDLYSYAPGDDVDSFSRASTATYFGHPPDMEPEDVDYYNDFRNGDPRPALGPGLPEFSRAGTRWVWDGEHFVEIAGDIERFSPRDVPGGKVRRMLELALAATGKIPDSVDFSSGSGWSRANLGSEAQKLSAFEGLPTGGEARELVGDGTGVGEISRSAGSSTSAKECGVMVVEDNGDGGWVSIVATDDTGAYIDVEYNLDTGEIVENTGSAHLLIEKPSGENGRKMVVLVGVGTGNGTTGREFQYQFDPRTNTKGAIFHYCDAFESSFVPGLNPTVGSPVAMPAEQFHVSPGPYRSDEVQVGYIALIGGTLLADSGSRHILEHGDGTNPRTIIREFNGDIDFSHLDADGNQSIRSIPVPSSDPRQRLQFAYVYDPTDGQARLLAKFGTGSWQDSGAGTPANWTKPDSWGADERINYNEAGSLDGSVRGRQFYERHHIVRERRLHNNPFYGAAEDVGAEIAGIFVAPDGSRVVSTGV